MSSVAPRRRSRAVSALVPASIILCGFAIPETARSAAFEHVLRPRGARTEAFAAMRRSTHRFVARHAPKPEAWARELAAAIKPGGRDDCSWHQRAQRVHKAWLRATRAKGDPARVLRIRADAMKATFTGRAEAPSNGQKQYFLGRLIRTLTGIAERAQEDRDHHDGLFQDYYARAFALAAKISDELHVRDDLIALVYDPASASNWEQATDGSWSFARGDAINEALVEMDTLVTPCDALARRDHLAALLRRALLQNEQIRHRVAQRVATRVATLARAAADAARDPNPGNMHTIERIRARAAELGPAIATLVDARVPGYGDLERALYELATTRPGGKAPASSGPLTDLMDAYERSLDAARGSGYLPE